MKNIFNLVAVALLFGFCSAAHAATPSPAEDLCASGEAKADKGDQAGAIADYNRAIELDPKCATAYSDRGAVKQDQGDVDGAIADDTRAIELDPTNAYTFGNRGTLRQSKGDLDGAIADLTRAIEIDPDAVNFHENLGNIRQTRGDTDGAMADFNRAIQIDAKSPLPYVFRGVENIRLGKWPAALADFRLACKTPAKGDGLVFQDYARLYVWVSRARMGELDAANKELSSFLAKRTDGAPGDWYSRLAGFLTGSVTEADLLTAASVPDKTPDPDQHCEAWYYAGMKKLLAGNKKGAADYFRRALATERRACEEYQLAQSELKASGE